MPERGEACFAGREGNRRGRAGRDEDWRRSLRRQKWTEIEVTIGGREARNLQGLSAPANADCHRIRPPWKSAFNALLRFPSVLP